MIKYFLSVLPVCLISLSMCGADSSAGLGPEQYPEYVQADANAETEVSDATLVVDFSSLS